MAVSGDFIVIGEHFSEIEGKHHAGRAYILSTEPSKGGGIPGFSYEVIILGLVGGVIIR